MQKVFDKAIDVNVQALDKSRDFLVKHEKKQPTRVWIGMGALLGAVLAGVVAGYLLRDFGKRNIEYMPDMAYSKAWESQQTHHYPEWKTPEVEANLPNSIYYWGTADMAPPDGTIFRGQELFPYAPDEKGRLQAREDTLSGKLVNPFGALEGAEREAMLERGKRLFKMNCQGCHGVDGVGNAPVTKFGVGAPTLVPSSVPNKYEGGEVVHIITYGINTMPAHASHVELKDRWKIFSYLRYLNKSLNQ